MQTVATANVNDDADTAGMPHVNTGLPSFKDAGPPKLQPSCPTSSPRLRQQAAHHSKREAQSRRRRKDRYEQLQYAMLGRGKEKDRKQSAYAEESEISSDEDDIKNSVLLRTYWIAVLWSDSSIRWLAPPHGRTFPISTPLLLWRKRHHQYVASQLEVFKMFKCQPYFCSPRSLFKVEMSL
jgi:hypothetical protein